MKEHSHIVCALDDSQVLVRVIWSPQKHSREILFFSDWRMGRLLVDELRHVQEQQLADSLAWVVMPDHIHWLLQLNSHSLSSVVQRVKSKSAIAINRARSCSGPFGKADSMTPASALRKAFWICPLYRGQSCSSQPGQKRARLSLMGRNLAVKTGLFVSTLTPKGPFSED